MKTIYLLENVLIEAKVLLFTGRLRSFKQVGIDKKYSTGYVSAEDGIWRCCWQLQDWLSIFCRRCI